MIPFHQLHAHSQNYLCLLAVLLQATCAPPLAPQVQTWFHALTRAHFHGALKPPFNEHARTQAGFDPTWYLPLAEKGQAVAGKAQTRVEQADQSQQAQVEGGVGGGAQGISCGATD